jgi:hypothetical protein
MYTYYISHTIEEYLGIIIIIIISLLMSHCWGTGLPYGLHIRRTGHNQPRRPSAG